MITQPPTSIAAGPTFSVSIVIKDGFDNIETDSADIVALAGSRAGARTIDCSMLGRYVGSHQRSPAYGEPGWAGYHVGWKLSGYRAFLVRVYLIA